VTPLLHVTRRVRAFCLALLVTAIVIFAFARRRNLPRASGRTERALGHLAAGSVLVDFAIEYQSSEHAWIRATFTPTIPNSHLYGKDLPKAGIHGLGRPTLVELISSSVLRSSGPISDDSPAHALSQQGVGVALPVYPAGPVILRLPVIHTGGVRGTAVLSVTYMACTEDLCLPAVSDRRVRVAVPAAGDFGVDGKRVR
jgi:hypothetical protein